MIILHFPINWTAGWILILLGFISGAILGLGFHKPDFLGGYSSFPRRLLRLGHIAFVALGILNLLFAIGPIGDASAPLAQTASVAFIAGGLLMPAVCFATAAWPSARHLFFLPVGSLVVAVGSTIFSLLR